MKEKVYLQITSGRGPAECCRVVALVLERIVRQAQASGLKMEMIEREVGPVNRTLLSATIALQGAASGELADEWEGTVQWIAQSPYRIYHKRKNWFVGVHSFVLSESQEATERDFRYETLRASGPGGQHVNKTESAIRVTHLPTGTVVECQDQRSQYKNKDRAMKILRSKLYEAEQARQNAEIAATRRSQVGTGDRSGKIRTYNFPQNRVTDHRLTGDSKNFNLAAVINGDLDALIDALTLADQTRRLQEGYEKGE